MRMQILKTKAIFQLKIEVNKIIFRPSELSWSEDDFVNFNLKLKDGIGFWNLLPHKYSKLVV